MPVEVTDVHAQLVRSFLTDDTELMNSLLRRVPKSNEPDGTSVLLWCAFVEAVRHRFNGGTSADVIRFVAHARVRRGRNAPSIDPAVAEKLIFQVLRGTSTDDLTDLQKAQHIILLSELVEDEQFDDASLDGFLTVALQYADRLAATL